MDVRNQDKVSNILCSIIEELKSGDFKISTVAGLIECGAEVNYQNECFNGNTPLHLGVIKNDADLVKLLLKNNADKTLFNNDGKTAGDLAIESNNHDVIKLLDIAQLSKISSKLIRTLKYNDDDDRNDDKENIDFKILRITKCPSKSEAIEMLSKQKSKDLFNKALYFFAILIEVDCEELDVGIDQLNDLFAGQQILIFQMQSMTNKSLKTYYKDEKSSEFKALNTFISHSQGQFSFDAFINQFGIQKCLTDISLPTLQILDKQSRLYQATQSYSTLCLRFLMLFKWNLHEKSFSDYNPIFVSLRSDSEKAFSALLDLPINMHQNEIILTENQSNLLKMKDDRGYNFLMFATEHGKSSLVQFLIHLQCFNVNEKACDLETASDIAWKNKYFEVLIKLLKNDSLFPKEFEASAILNNDEPTGLKTFLTERISFHEKLKKGEIKTVQKFVKSHCQMKLCFDLENNSALKIALDYFQYEIFAFLQSEGFKFGPNEHKESIISELDDYEKETLRKAQLKYFINPEKPHIEQLVSSSRLGFGLNNKKNYFKQIRKFFVDLDEIDEISPILKTVANAKSVEIIFDFKSDSIGDVNLAASEKDMGKTYYKSGHIYVGALREDLDVLGTLSHELTHLAMQLVFENNCKPFRSENDQGREERFGNIVKSYEGELIRSRERIINLAYSYKGEERIAELIARVPHILANYKNNPSKINDLKHNFKELFNYYDELLESDLKVAHFLLKDRILLKEFNKICGVYDQLKELELYSKGYDQIELQEKLLVVIETNHPFLMMKNVQNNLEGADKHPPNYLHVFITLEQFCNKKKYLDKIQEISKLNSNPKFFVVQTSAEYENTKYFKDLIADLNKAGNQIIFLVYLKGLAYIKDLVYSLDEHYAEHKKIFKWNDLTKASQVQFLSQKVKLRGNDVEWKNIFDSQSNMLENLEVHEIIDQKNVFNDIEEKEIESYLMTDIYISRIFEIAQENNSATEKMNEDQIIQWAEKTKIVMIVDDAGKGKTTILKQIKRKLEETMPYRLTVIIDLKQYTSKFDDMQMEFNEENLLSKIENILNISNEFDKKLFKDFLANGKVCLLLDGFDEIDETSREFVLKLMKSYAASNKNQLWFGSRTHFAKELEENLDSKAFKMSPFTIEDQKIFLFKFWKSESKNNFGNLEEIAEALIVKLKRASFHGEFENFFGIPLQLRMLAEIFKHNLSNIDDCCQNIFFDNEKVNLYRFYEFFTSKMMEKWVKGNPISFSECDSLIDRLRHLRQFHCVYAFQTIIDTNSHIISRDQLESLHLDLPNLLSDDLIVKFGILTRTSSSRKFEFYHRTFAEFYAAQFLLTEIIQNESKENYFELLFVIFLGILSDLRHLTFINGALKTKQFDNLFNSESKFFKKLKENIFDPRYYETICVCFQGITMQCQDKLTHLFLQVIGDDCEFLNRIMQGPFHCHEPFMHKVSKYCDFATFIVIYRHIELKYKKESLMDLLLNKNKISQICLFPAVLNHDRKVFDFLFEIFRNFLRFNIISLLDYDDSLNRNLLHYAMHPSDEFHDHSFAENGNTKIFQLLIEKFKTFLPEKSNQKDLFTHKNGQTRLHEILGTPGVPCERIEIFWSFFCEVFNESERKKKLMEINHKNQNILGALIEYRGTKGTVQGPRDNHQVIECLLPKILRAIGKKCFKAQVLFKDKEGNNFLHNMAVISNKNNFQCVLKFMTEKFETKELRKILVFKNNLKETCFMRCEVEIYYSLPILEQAEIHLEEEDIKSFLKIKNSRGQTFLHCFVLWGTDEQFKTVWNLFRKHLNDDELKEIMLFEEKIGNVLFVAVLCKNSERFNICLETAKLFCKQDELKEAILNRFMTCMEREEDRYLFDSIKMNWDTIRAKTLNKVLDEVELKELDTFYR